MRLVAACLCVFLAMPAALAENKVASTATVAAEVGSLWRAYNEAGAKKDRIALERLFAEGWVWVQANGRVVDRETHLRNILRDDWRAAPMPSLERLDEYGNIALLRGALERGIYSTTVLAKIEGRWCFLHAQSTRLPAERKAIAVDPGTLDRFTGRYEFAPGAVAVVTKEGDALLWKGGGRPVVKLLPLSERHFFAEGTDSEMIFRVGDEGRVTGVMLRLGTVQESEAKKTQ
ncbi:MAG TPA: DUF3471 domain-containing protein [Steroidobacteraceae bacterium]|nr:DUF3471 domain-containing protein [Steroidobacteraceae bacterium]